jgi:hypothetical protein
MRWFANVYCGVAARQGEAFTTACSLAHVGGGEQFEQD